MNAADSGKTYLPAAGQDWLLPLYDRFVVPVRTIHAGPNPKYFGYERGVTYYNLVSDQFTGLNAIVVPGTLRDSLVLLAVVLEQPTELNPIEIMTDTGAYTDVVFGLFWLLGYRFSPRIADIRVLERSV
jgi:TnpA family transposase